MSNGSTSFSVNVRNYVYVYTSYEITGVVELEGQIQNIYPHVFSI